jgi:hypothetical protein
MSEYIKDDFPTILMICYIVLAYAFYEFTGNFWLSFGMASTIYLIAYLTFKLWTSIED